MLSTCPLWTWNTQVLWLLQPPWHELSIRLFQSNSPAGLCHLYFHNCLESWFWRERQSVLPRLTSSLVSGDKRNIQSLSKKRKVHVSSLPQHVCLGNLLYTSLFVNFIKSCVIFLKYLSTSRPPTSWFFYPSHSSKTKVGGRGAVAEWWWYLRCSQISDLLIDCEHWTLFITYDGYKRKSTNKKKNQTSTKEANFY